MRKRQGVDSNENVRKALQKNGLLLSNTTRNSDDISIKLRNNTFIVRGPTQNLRKGVRYQALIRTPSSKGQVKLRDIKRGALEAGLTIQRVNKVSMKKGLARIRRIAEWVTNRIDED